MLVVSSSSKCHHFSLNGKAWFRLLKTFHFAHRNVWYFIVWTIFLPHTKTHIFTGIQNKRNYSHCSTNTFHIRTIASKPFIVWLNTQTFRPFSTFLFLSVLAFCRWISILLFIALQLYNLIHSLGYKRNLTIN